MPLQVLRLVLIRTRSKSPVSHQVLSFSGPAAAFPEASQCPDPALGVLPEERERLRARTRRAVQEVNTELLFTTPCGQAALAGSSRRWD